MTDPMEMSELMVARKLGITAYYLGRELEHNPFDKANYPELFAAWEEGFKSEAGNWEEFK